MQLHVQKTILAIIFTWMQKQIEEEILGMQIYTAKKKQTPNQYKEHIFLAVKAMQ